MKLLFLTALFVCIAPCAAMEKSPQVVTTQSGTREKPEFRKILKDPMSNAVYGWADYGYSFEIGPVIERLYILPQFRKQGYGRFLLTQTLDHFKQFNFKRVNIRARAFEALGSYTDEELLAHQANRLPQLINFYKNFGGIVLSKNKYEARMSLATSNTKSNQE